MSSPTPSRRGPPTTPRPPGLLVVLGVAVALICAIPLLYLALRAFSGGPEALQQWLLRGRTAELTGRTLLLTATVVAGCLVLGTGTALALTRIALPAPRLWLVLAAMPLAVPRTYRPSPGSPPGRGSAGSPRWR